MPKKKLAVIACGVLEWNIEQIARRLPETELTVHALPAQLHENPGRLRELLQEKIDALESVEGLEGIVMGYGV